MLLTATFALTAWMGGRTTNRNATNSGSEAIAGELLSNTGGSYGHHRVTENTGGSYGHHRVTENTGGSYGHHRVTENTGGSYRHRRVYEADFQTVNIGGQIWMAENLNVDRFRNGDIIFHARTEEEWITAGENRQAAWCYYDNDSVKGPAYGKLYNWYAVNDPRGLAPEGWKIPSGGDWLVLFRFLGGAHLAGAKMKSTEHWADYKGESGNGTNESGFKGLPGGFRNSDGYFFAFDSGKHGYWWSSELCETYLEPLCLKLFYYEDFALLESNDAVWGLSVRCLKDETPSED